jgi:hypothetical protein
METRKMKNQKLKKWKTKINKRVKQPKYMLQRNLKQKANLSKQRLTFLQLLLKQVKYLKLQNLIRNM